MKTDGESYALSRRRFLTRVVQTIVLGSMSSCAMDLRQGATPPLPAWFRHTVKYPQAARRFGLIYLKAHPREANMPYLVRSIEAAMTHSDSKHVKQLSLQLLDETIRQEFQQGKIVSIEGWMVSQSEARFYALVELSVNRHKKSPA